MDLVDINNKTSAILLSSVLPTRKQITLKMLCIAVNGTPSHSYWMSLAIWDRKVLPVTRHK